MPDQRRSGLADELSRTEVSRPDCDGGEPTPPSLLVKYEHSRHFLPLLSQLGASLAVSTYQAGKVVLIGCDRDQLKLSFHHFQRAMGLAVKPDCIAVGTRNLVWFLRNAPEIAPQLDPAGCHRGCFLARKSYVTGEIQSHEMAWVGDDLWVVNTLFSCLCTVHESFSFIPRWRPPFISALAAEDRCHLNGLALVDGQPRYVTVMAESDTPGGWREKKESSGCLIDVPSGQTVARGFAMPHSPRVYGGRLWLLDSGCGLLVQVDPATGKAEPVAEFPGYTRGLAFCGSLAFVGLSRIRETSVFSGIPIAAKRDELKCGVAVVDLPSGRVVAFLVFTSVVDEIFDVQVLPGMPWPALSGPFPDADNAQTIWNVAEPSVLGASRSNR